MLSSRAQHWPALATAAFHSEQQPAVVAPILTNEKGSVFGRRFYSPISLILARTRARSRVALARDPAGVEWVLGACFAMRRQALLTLGGLDSRFFLYFEDVDPVLARVECGGVVRVLPGVHIYHSHRRASRQVSRVFLWHIRSAARFFMLHPRQSSDEVRGIGGRDAQEPLRGCAKGGPSKLGGSLRSQVARDIRAGEYGASVDTSHWSELMATLRDWINPPDEWEEKGQSGLRYFLAIREKRIIAGEWLRHI